MRGDADAYLTALFLGFTIYFYTGNPWGAFSAAGFTFVFTHLVIRLINEYLRTNYQIKESRRRKTAVRTL